MSGAAKYRCEAADCRRTFKHAGEENDCPTVEGRCAHLMNAGWRPVYVGVTAFAGGKHRKLFVRGGWLCATHATEQGGRFA